MTNRYCLWGGRRGSTQLTLRRRSVGTCTIDVKVNIDYKRLAKQIRRVAKQVDRMGLPR